MKNEELESLNKFTTTISDDIVDKSIIIHLAVGEERYEIAAAVRDELNEMIKEAALTYSIRLQIPIEEVMQHLQGQIEYVRDNLLNNGF